MASKVEGYPTTRIAVLPTHGAHEAGGMATKQQFVNCQPQASKGMLTAGCPGTQKGSSRIVCMKAQTGPAASSVVPILGSMEASGGIAYQPGQDHLSDSDAASNSAALPRP